jgi:hypothetical protein
MPDLPLLSQTDVTIQNQTTGQIDYLKYQGSTLTNSRLFDYGLGSGWNIVANDLGSNGRPSLVAQNVNTGFVDFLNLDANGNLVSSLTSAVPVPHIFGAVPDALEWFGSQLANGQLDFLQFNQSTGALTASDLVATPVPKAVSMSTWNSSPGPPAWAGLGGGLTGDIVQTQTADGSPDMIGFSGSLGAMSLAVSSSFFISAPGTPAFGEANPDIVLGENLQDSAGTPQGLQEIAQTSTGQIDALYYDTGLGDPVASNEGILYASNLLGSFPGWNVIQGDFVNNSDIFPIS